jgi:hypothetical protein
LKFILYKIKIKIIIYFKNLISKLIKDINFYKNTNKIFHFRNFFLEQH